jgi:hypothetical protein
VYFRTKNEEEYMDLREGNERENGECFSSGIIVVSKPRSIN